MDFEIVGESFHESSFHNLVGFQKRGGYRQKCTAVVSLEDDNPYDERAVKVSICGYDVGHFSRANAQAFRNFLDRKDISDREFLVDAVIIGGRLGEDYGVYLDINVKTTTKGGGRQKLFEFNYSGDYDEFEVAGESFMSYFELEDKKGRRTSSKKSACDESESFVTSEATKLNKAYLNIRSTSPPPFEWLFRLDSDRTFEFLAKLSLISSMAIGVAIGTARYFGF